MLKSSDVGRIRSRNMRLDGSSLATPAEVVAWHGAVQAQEYAQAKWSVAQRTPGVTAEEIDRAVADGTILRTHALRPTWHFLARDDARWILDLTGPRIQRSLASRYERLGLDPKELARARRAILKALAKGAHLTRKEIGEFLARSRIDVSGQRLPHMLSHAELDAAICSGARRRNEHTYAAFDERVPASKSVDLQDATRRLVTRYLQSHGPASVTDIQWWASLKATDVKAALEEMRPQTDGARIDGVDLWWFEQEASPGTRSSVRLLETYDEFIVGYTRTRFMGDRFGAPALAAWRGASRFGNIVTRGGNLVGSWKRTKTAGSVNVQVRSYDPLSASHLRSLRGEVARFGRFYGLEPALEVSAMGTSPT